MNRVLAASFVVLIAACGTSTHSQDSRDGGDDGGSSTFPVGDASGAEGGLGAHIAQGKVAVKLVTVSCSGDCVTVQAVGTGGSPPYSYKWEDGSTNPVRQLCPEAAAAYAVNVTDSGEAGEIPRPPQTVKASVTADVLACPDAGIVDASPPAAPSDACVGGFVNASIEGTPQTEVGGAWDAPGWTQCPSEPFRAYLASASVHPGNGVTYPAPTSGATYAVFAAKGSDDETIPHGFGQTLCTPSEAGASFNVDSRWIDPGIPGSPDPAGTLVQLEIFVGQTVCDGYTTGFEEATNVPITQTWDTYCFTIDAQSPVGSITFTGLVNNPDGTVDPNATALILIDHVVPVASCP
jgi:hypothetical protein